MTLDELYHSPLAIQYAVVLGLFLVGCIVTLWVSPSRGHTTTTSLTKIIPKPLQSKKHVHQLKNIPKKELSMGPTTTKRPVSLHPHPLDPSLEPTFTFCEQCITNQNHVTRILAAYLPENEEEDNEDDDDDLDDNGEDSSRAQYQTYKASLEQRYPICCPTCGTRAKHYLRKLDEKAAIHLQLYGKRKAPSSPTKKGTDSNHESFDLSHFPFLSIALSFHFVCLVWNSIAICLNFTDLFEFWNSLKSASLRIEASGNPLVLNLERYLMLSLTPSSLFVLILFPSLSKSPSNPAILKSSHRATSRKAFRLVALFLLVNIVDIFLFPYTFNSYPTSRFFSKSLLLLMHSYMARFHLGHLNVLFRASQKISRVTSTPSAAGIQSSSAHIDLSRPKGTLNESGPGKESLPCAKTKMNDDEMLNALSLGKSDYQRHLSASFSIFQSDSHPLNRSLFGTASDMSAKHANSLPWSMNRNVTDIPTKFGKRHSFQSVQAPDFRLDSNPSFAYPAQFSSSAFPSKSSRELAGAGTILPSRFDLARPTSFADVISRAKITPFRESFDSLMDDVSATSSFKPFRDHPNGESIFDMNRGTPTPFTLESRERAFVKKRLSPSISDDSFSMKPQTFLPSSESTGLEDLLQNQFSLKSPDPVTHALKVAFSSSLNSSRDIAQRLYFVALGFLILGKLTASFQWRTGNVIAEVCYMLMIFGVCSFVLKRRRPNESQAARTKKSRISQGGKVAFSDHFILQRSSMFLSGFRAMGFLLANIPLCTWLTCPSYVDFTLRSSGAWSWIILGVDLIQLLIFLVL